MLICISTHTWVHTIPEFILCIHRVHNLYTMSNNNVKGLRGMRFEGMSDFNCKNCNLWKSAHRGLLNKDNTVEPLYCKPLNSRNLCNMDTILCPSVVL